MLYNYGQAAKTTDELQMVNMLWKITESSSDTKMSRFINNHYSKLQNLLNSEKFENILFKFTLESLKLSIEKGDPQLKVRLIRMHHTLYKITPLSLTEHNWTSIIFTLLSLVNEELQDFCQDRDNLKLSLKKKDSPQWAQFSLNKIKEKCALSLELSLYLCDILYQTIPSFFMDVPSHLSSNITFSSHFKNECQDETLDHIQMLLKSLLIVGRITQQLKLDLRETQYQTVESIIDLFNRIVSSLNVHHIHLSQTLNVDQNLLVKWFREYQPIHHQMSAAKGRIPKIDWRNPKLKFETHMPQAVESYAHAQLSLLRTRLHLDALDKSLPTPTLIHDGYLEVEQTIAKQQWCIIKQATKITVLEKQLEQALQRIAQRTDEPATTLTASVASLTLGKNKKNQGTLSIEECALPYLYESKFAARYHYK